MKQEMDRKKARLIFLGTGTSQGVPPIGCNHPVCKSNNLKDKRLRTSALIQLKEKNFIFDCGPDFRQQLLRESVSSLEGIIFTHEHNDHVSGLDDIRALYFAQGGKAVPLYCPKEVEKSIRTRFGYFFAENKYPGVPDVLINEISGDPFGIADVTFQPIEVFHGRAKIYGYRVGKMVYITDASFIAPKEMEKINGCDVLVLNALREEPKHYSHFTLSEAIEIVEKIAPKKAYFTHISHLMGFHDEIEAKLPKNIHLAYDGLTLDFDL